MTTEIKEFIEKNGKQYQFLPLVENKSPKAKTWSKTERLDYDFRGCYGIGLICGSISNNIEVIDVDLKYDLTGTLGKRLGDAINLADPTILTTVTIQRTVNKGLHFIYKCKERDGSLKLARRRATDHEQALKQEKVKVLIETRGDGGYIVCYPTKGYSIARGSLDDVKEITPAQRRTLFDVCCTFNEYFEEYKPIVRLEKKVIKGKTPFEDYNERGDVVTILESHGWKTVKRDGVKILFKRPGDTSAAHSGNFNEDNRWFSVFSTSTEFEPEKGYLPYAVYGMLKHKGDWAETARDLYHQGFGERIERQSELQGGTPSKIDKLSDDKSFVASEKDFEDYLERVRNGTFELGKSTGIPALDDFFRVKDGNFVVINGHDNVGKSVIIWYLALLTSLLYGWKWIIYSSENTVGFFYRKMIEFYWCEQLHKIDPKRYKEAKDFITKHYRVILSSDELFNGQEIIDMADKIISEEDIQGLMVDPYNSLKIELNNASKLSTHEYHYEQISNFKLFGKRKKLSIYINCHAVTNSLRKQESGGAAVAPQKADTEGGGKFGNKADDFLTIHRKVQSKDEWMITEIHVRKIKETETGGKITPQGDPVKLKSLNKMSGFEDKNGYNPVLEWHKKNQLESQGHLFKTEPIISEEVKEELDKAIDLLYNDNLTNIDPTDTKSKQLF